MVLAPVPPPAAVGRRTLPPPISTAQAHTSDCGAGEELSADESGSATPPTPPLVPPDVTAPWPHAAAPGAAAAPSATPSAAPSAAPSTAPPPAARAPPRSALSRRSGVDGVAAAPASKRRLKISIEAPERIYYEPCQERPVDNYHHSLQALQQIRHQRDMEMKPNCSFAELVSELDFREGGEALSCLAPRKADPEPGAWMTGRGHTWGQILSK